MRALLRSLVAALLGVAAALLVSCGGSGKGLIPAAAAGPLQSDFEAVASAAAAGNGSCTATEAALAKTERDYATLPASVDHGLRSRLHEGISSLRRQGLSMCAQPVATVTTATSATTATTAPPATTTTTTTTATTPPPATPSPSNEGGGTEAPEGEAREGPGKGKGEGNGKGRGKDHTEGEAESGPEGEAGGASAGGTRAGGE